MLDYNAVFDRLIDHEGGYVNNPDDPGGETKFGISKRSYPHLNIKALTIDDARQIYKDDFWNKIHADKLPDGVAYQLMDFAINSGPRTAIVHLQLAISVVADGYWGPISQARLDSLTESDLIMRILAARIDFMVNLSNWPSASRGWMRRIAKNLRYGAEDSD